MDLCLVLISPTCASSRLSSVCPVKLVLRQLRFGLIFDVTKASKSTHRDGMRSGNVSVNFSSLTTVPHSSFLQGGYLCWILSGSRNQKILVTLLDWDTTVLLPDVGLHRFTSKRSGTTFIQVTKKGVLGHILSAGSEVMCNNFLATRVESNI